MSARRKLNAAFFNGSLFVAALIGWFVESWTVFLLALAALVVANLFTGEIRLGKRR